MPRAIAGDPRWRYSQRASADFDGDGREETAVVITDVELDARGAPLWEDGHRYTIGIYEIRYSGPQKSSSVRHLHRELDPGKGFTERR